MEGCPASFTVHVTFKFSQLEVADPYATFYYQDVNLHGCSIYSFVLIKHFTIKVFSKNAGIQF